MLYALMNKYAITFEICKTCNIKFGVQIRCDIIMDILNFQRRAYT
jgi:hypothetical protein